MHCRPAVQFWRNMDSNESPLPGPQNGLLSGKTFFDSALGWKVQRLRKAACRHNSAQTVWHESARCLPPEIITKFFRVLCRNLLHEERFFFLLTAPREVDSA